MIHKFIAEFLLGILFEEMVKSLPGTWQQYSFHCGTFSLTSSKGKCKCYFFSSQGKRGGGEGEKARPDKNGDGPGRALHSR